MGLVAELIAGGRLTLVPLAVEHAREMAGVLADPALYAFTGGIPPTEPDLRVRYERWIAGSPDPGQSWCNWVIQLHRPRCLTGTVQATISSSAGADRLVAEVAWVVGTRWQGQGLATEAARALVGWLERQSVRTVVAHIHPDHRASASVAAAVGLVPTDDWHDGERMWRLTLPASLASPRPSRRDDGPSPEPTGGGQADHEQGRGGHREEAAGDPLQRADR